jgi:hypothetical protein
MLALIRTIAFQLLFLASGVPGKPGFGLLGQNSGNFGNSLNDIPRQPFLPRLAA